MQYIDPSKASSYAASRPAYPESLFHELAALSLSKELAWDVACGNGQATIELAKYFAKVVGTDVSLAQLQNTSKTTNILYHLGKGEQSSLGDQTVDLVTVGQALHWLERPKFIEEVERVLKTGGIFAYWTFNDINLSDESLTQEIQNFTKGIFKAFTPSEWHEAYEEPDFAVPFQNSIQLNRHTIQTDWNLLELDSFLNTRADVRRYMEVHGNSPVPEFLTKIGNLWGDPFEKKQISWDMNVTAYRK